MELREAIRLIENGVEKTAGPQIWADYGAGKGLFTKALASLLPAGSRIYAIDNNADVLRTLSFGDDRIALEKLDLDFTKDTIPSENLDGVLMANSLHYAKDATAVLKNIRAKLLPSGHIIIIEYERTSGNQWVPYPVNFAKLQQLSVTVGFSEVIKLQEIPSAFQQGNIYSALIR
jgi:SAM-dependent methyltransferase